MNRISESPAQCELCEEFIAAEDARIVCPDCFTAAQNIPPWHPIEKAPKDGKRILLYGKCAREGLGIFVGAFEKSFSTLRPREGWRSPDGFWIEATHFMLLPEKPKDGDE